MSPVPLYHLSTVGRAAIDLESARIKQELATRRVARESRLDSRYGIDDMGQVTMSLDAAAEAADPRDEDVADRP
jgi:hypothetical protein